MGNDAKWTILLDLDDTLIANTHMYHTPSLRCCLLISAALGEKSVHPLELLKTQLEIDIAMVKTHGYGVDRFPRSWVKTYEAVARKSGVAVDRKVSASIMKAASAFTHGPFQPFAGVKEALMDLQRDGHTLHLVTAGDKRLQERKVRSSGLAALFDSVNVTGVDKKAVMAKIARESKGPVMMVGDSTRSDIKPAIELGIVAVHVPSNTWAFAQAEVDPRRYRTITSVRELPALVAKLSRAVRRPLRVKYEHA
jgi:putative hydrolase of the HAD superfamily